MKNKIIIGLIIFSLMMIGILTTVWAVINIQNYEHPYLFALIFGGLGVWIGVKIAKKFKNKIAIKREMQADFWKPIIFISTGVMGLILLSASYLNNKTADLVSCKDYQVIDKHRKKGGSRDPEINSIYFNIDGQTRRIVCKHKYWDNVRIGQRINVCIYESKINFDFISIDENE